MTVVSKFAVCLWMAVPMAALAGSLYQDSDSLLATLERKHGAPPQTGTRSQPRGNSLYGSKQAGDYPLTYRRGGPHTDRNRAKVTWLDGRTRQQANRSSTQYSWRNLRRQDFYPPSCKTPFAPLSITR